MYRFAGRVGIEGLGVRSPHASVSRARAHMKGLRAKPAYTICSGQIHLTPTVCALKI